jgi:hypothetical protein
MCAGRTENTRYYIIRTTWHGINGNNNKQTTTTKRLRLPWRFRLSVLAVLLSCFLCCLWRLCYLVVLLVSTRHSLMPQLRSDCLLTSPVQKMNVALILSLFLFLSSIAFHSHIFNNCSAVPAATMSKPEIILHHYQGSPYAEKVVAALRIKGLPWCSVVTSHMMPRP